MTRAEQGFRERMNRSFAPFRNVPREHVEAACARVLHDLREEGDSGPEPVETPSIPVHAGGTWIRAAATLSAAAAVVAAVLWMPIRDLAPESGVSARVEMVDGGLYRGPRDEGLRPGDRIDAGDLVRTNGGAGAMVVLSDGSRVEMRSESELALERADDGIRIRLNRGGIIVNAAERRDGHLYVQTSDVTVSVVGTVFLVNAEAEGSRVAVIEGEVRVQQGTMEKTLLAGEQVATNLVMATQPVRGGLSWSRNAAAHIVRLQESTAVASSPSSQSVAERRSSTQPPVQQRLAFETVSIRPSTSGVVPGGRGGGPVPANGCGNGLLQVDPRRVFLARVTLQWLIVTAYSPWTEPRAGCEGVGNANLLAGGPDWVRSDVWDVEALIPQDGRDLTLDLVSETGSDLQEMLQAVLADRFRLVLRSETRQRAVYLLRVRTGGARFNGPIDLGRRIVFEGDNGKLVGPDEVRGAAKLWRNRDENGSSFVRFGAFNMSMAAWSRLLSRDAGRLVLDRTGLTGEFSFHFEYDPAGVTRPTLFNAVEEIGLKFEEGEAPVEAWLIERAEKPTEN